MPVKPNGYDAIEEFKGFERRKLPPGVYPIVITNAKLEAVDFKNEKAEMLKLALDINDGEYTGLFAEWYEQDKGGKFSSNARWKGTYQVKIPTDADELSLKTFKTFDTSLTNSNDGFSLKWTNDDAEFCKQFKGLKALAVFREFRGIYNGIPYENVEVAWFRSLTEDTDIISVPPPRTSQERKDYEQEKHSDGFVDSSPGKMNPDSKVLDDITHGFASLDDPDKKSGDDLLF